MRTSQYTDTSATLPTDPFADRSALDSNPFADPSVQGALSGSRTYEADAYSAAPQSSKSVFEEEESSTPRATTAQLDDIQRRERELQRREEELAQRAENIRKHGRNNWPFCEFTSCFIGGP